MIRQVFILKCCLLLTAAPLLYPSEVDRFYREKRQSLFWFSGRAESEALRGELITAIDSAAWIGLDSTRYHLAEIRSMASGAASGGAADPGSGRKYDSATLMYWDRLYTDAAIALCKDVYKGRDIYDMVTYDGVSGKFEARDDQWIMGRLTAIQKEGDFRNLCHSLEPGGKEYDSLRGELDSALARQDSAAIRQWDITLNIYRWMQHFRFPSFVVVNIPSATLRYYEQDTMQLSMKVVAGQLSKRTPRFAAWCDQLILYPYWNVPGKIAVNEFLPLFKKVPASVDVMNMQVIDTKGRRVDPTGIRWAAYNKDNFPFSLRQSTGCDNALGVVKFNLTSPYDVYMHDTNYKRAFNSASRYYSHGCIRLEKPFELARLLLKEKLDTAYLNSCYKDQEPTPQSLVAPVPVFVVYLTAWVDEGGRWKLYKDVYHLVK